MNLHDINTIFLSIRVLILEAGLGISTVDTQESDPLNLNAHSPRVDFSLE